jgi:hypothetical protein
MSSVRLNQIDLARGRSNRYKHSHRNFQTVEEKTELPGLYSARRFKWDGASDAASTKNVDRDLSTARERHTYNTDEPNLFAGLTPTEILNALDRIRGSRVMSGCHRLVQILEYVVRSALNEEGAHLKETTIGVAVFGRTPDYDPKADTIVRSQVWRLRAKLRKYYAVEASNDPVVIEIPIGQYAPTFRQREQAGFGR